MLMRSPTRIEFKVEDAQARNVGHQTSRLEGKGVLGFEVKSVGV